MNRLPIEIITKIFEHVEPSHRAILQFVCRDWYHVVNSRPFQRKFGEARLEFTSLKLLMWGWTSRVIDLEDQNWVLKQARKQGRREIRRAVASMQSGIGCWLAAYHNNLKLLQLVRDHGHEWDFDASCEIFRHDWELAEWAMLNGCPFHIDDCETLIVTNWHKLHCAKFPRCFEYECENARLRVRDRARRWVFTHNHTDHDRTELVQFSLPVERNLSQACEEICDIINDANA